MKIHIAPAARTDIDSIWLYVAQSSNPETATTLIEALARKFSLFARFPEIGRPLNAGQTQNVRTFAVDRYMIFYRHTAHEIRILRVVHTSRDAFAVFGNDPA